MRLLVSVAIFIFSSHLFATDAPALSTLNVNDLDSTLESKPLDQWLSSVLGKSWKISASKELTGCGEISGNPDQKDYPICLEINLESVEQKYYLYISVGTSKKGVSGKPAFHWGSVGNRSIYKLSKLVSVNAM